MQQLIAVKEIKQVGLQPGLLVQVLSVQDHVSVAVVEATLVNRFVVVRPEWELVYLLSGRANYDGGRSVRAGEAIINLPNVPHVFVTVGDELKVIIEVESPVPQAYLESGGWQSENGERTDR